jgi:hypothetical protein
MFLGSRARLVRRADNFAAICLDNVGSLTSHNPIGLHGLEPPSWLPSVLKQMQTNPSKFTEIKSLPGEAAKYRLKSVTSPLSRKKKSQLPFPYSATPEKWSSFSPRNQASLTSFRFQPRSYQLSSPPSLASVQQLCPPPPERLATGWTTEGSQLKSR